LEWLQINAKHWTQKYVYSFSSYSHVIYKLLRRVVSELVTIKSLGHLMASDLRNGGLDKKIAMGQNGKPYEMDMCKLDVIFIRFINREILLDVFWIFKIRVCHSR